MLRHSFIHLARIGPKTERRLWQAGLTAWERALDCPAETARQTGLCPQRWDQLRAELDESVRRLDAGDAGYFAGRLAASEAWRLYADFADGAAFLDIETDGFDRITAVVVHRAGQTLFFVRDANLHELPVHLAGVKLLVTYNGKSFDWPIIRSSFARAPEPAAHLDLRYPFYRCGFRGGLKGIEPAIGLARPDELAGIDGWAAVWLWQQHLRGERRALPALLRYCAEDVLNLKYLAEWLHNELAGPLPVSARLFACPRPARCDHLPQADAELMRQYRRAVAASRS